MARKKDDFINNIAREINDYSLDEIMEEGFGRYSKEIIQERALPDVRDGLKPVQRRILFAMHKAGYTYNKPYQKSAKAVGYIMGNFHPHGDSSIYDALIHLSQPWKMRKTFIDIHGNNGSIDGDGPAAMRYTEARLSKIAETMLEDIQKNTVEMTYNFDDTELEPTVLPARFPNLLINGSQGISAGYATNIPTHNLGEVIDATIHRIENPNCRLDTIMNYVPGPDFPTGGVIEGREDLEKAYTTGKGKVVLRADCEIVEEKSHKQIIVHSIPYGVVKDQLTKKITEIRLDKKIDGINDVVDESDYENMARLVIDLKKGANADLILKYLYKNTDLQTNYNFNMVAIVNRRPKYVGILEILDAFISHQREVVTRRTKYDKEKAEARLNVLEGVIRALSILDDVIRTIRASKNKADSIENLQKEYEFNYEQAKYIVEMQLYRLTNTDIIDVQNEIEELKKKIAIWTQILNNEEALKHVMITELKLIKKEYADPRRTKIVDEVTKIEIDEKAMIPQEDVVVLVTKDGYVKRTSFRSYTASNPEDLTMKDNDYILGLYEMNTIDTILLFTSFGNYLHIPVHLIPDLKWKDMPKHVSNIIELSPGEEIIAVVPAYDFKSDINLILTTKNGMIKRTALKDFQLQRYGKATSCMRLKENDQLISVLPEKYDTIFLTTNTGYGLSFKTEEIPIIGSKAAGVKAMMLKDDYIVSANNFSYQAQEFLSVITPNGTGKRIRLQEFELSTRTRRGIQVIREVKSNPYYILKTFIEDVKNYIGLKNQDINTIKLTELPIADRHSIGSQISKHEIQDAFVIASLERKEEEQSQIESLTNEEPKIIKVIEEEKEIPKKEKIDLKAIDDRLMTIDDFLN